MNINNVIIPDWYMSIKYTPSVIPDGRLYDIFNEWANCQVFSYELLRLNGKNVPNLRSSELWEDQIFSYRVNNYKPLDILFFNYDDNSYWAHLWVYIWNNKVIHLSKQNWFPVIWSIDEFKCLKQYSVILWAKRFFNKK